MKTLSISSNSKHRFAALIDYGDVYVQPLILKALGKRLPKDSFDLLPSGSSISDHSSPYLQIKSYEELDFDDVMEHPTTCLANSYVFRKALIRKHYLSMTAHNWITKHPDSPLATHMKPSCDFELDYAEFLDDALVEAWELQTSFGKNEGKEPQDREWWILKPGMSDRGQGIRLFSSQDELQAIFDEWEADRPDSDDEEEEEGSFQPGSNNGDYIMTSQLRHFVAQPYIHPPLLVGSNPRKFHIRTYIVAVGALKVYVYRPMLALFAAAPYTTPWSSSSASAPPNLAAHLTNTCLQDGTREGSVLAFWDLPMAPSLPPDWKHSVFDQICAVTGDIFDAAARGMMVHFQTLPNAFEVFGLDFLVDAAGTACLLEVNAFPDFKQTGDKLNNVVAGFWEGVVDVAVKPFFGLEAGNEDGRMVLVKDVDLGRR